MSNAVNKVDFRPCHPVGTLSDKVVPTLFCARDLVGPLKGPGDKGRKPGVARQPDKVEKRASDLRSWDVHRFDQAFGVGKRLGRIKAPTIAIAQDLATAQHGERILVSPAGGRKRRPFIPRRGRR